MKRFTFLIAACLLFAGCGGTSEPPAPPEKPPLPAPGKPPLPTPPDNSGGPNPWGEYQNLVNAYLGEIEASIKAGKGAESVKAQADAWLKDNTEKVYTLSKQKQTLVLEDARTYGPKMARTVMWEAGIGKRVEEMISSVAGEDPATKLAWATAQMSILEFITPAMKGTEEAMAAAQ